MAAGSWHARTARAPAGSLGPRPQYRLPRAVPGGDLYTTTLGFYEVSQAEFYALNLAEALLSTLPTRSVGLLEGKRGGPRKWRRRGVCMGKLERAGCTCRGGSSGPRVDVWASSLRQTGRQPRRGLHSAGRAGVYGLVSAPRAVRGMPDERQGRGCGPRQRARPAGSGASRRRIRYAVTAGREPRVGRDGSLLRSRLGTLAVRDLGSAAESEGRDGGVDMPRLDCCRPFPALRLQLCRCVVVTSLNLLLQKLSRRKQGVCFRKPAPRAHRSRKGARVCSEGRRDPAGSPRLGSFPRNGSRVH